MRASTKEGTSRTRLGYVDLHSHWLPGIDDGVRSEAEGLALLAALKRAGFSTVIATPHMRPGMFDNDAAVLRGAYDAMERHVRATPDMPEVGLACEHFLSDTVFERILAGESLPYPGQHAILIELHAEIFPARLGRTFFELTRRKLRPVLAHPERYAAVWDDIEILGPLVDDGACMLLDVAALVGKYGRRAKKAATRLVEEGFYQAACSDAHRPDDVKDVTAGIEELRSIAGRDEAEFLLDAGPRAILAGST